MPQPTDHGPQDGSTPRPEWLDKFIGQPLYLTIPEYSELAAYVRSLEAERSRPIADMLQAAVDGKAAAEHRLANVMAERDSLRKQRDELLEALKLAVRGFEDDDYPTISSEDMQLLRDAIAKAEGAA